MFRFIFSLVVLLDSVVIIAARWCDGSNQQTQSYCYDNVEIKYPFWYDEGYRPEHGDYPYCGYPGFGIRCAENRSATVMNISNQLYSVTHFDSQSRYVRVKKLGIEKEECPHPIRNFSLSLQEFGSSLRDLSKYKWIFFYNCSDRPINDDFIEKFQHLACLDNSGRRSYFFPTYTYEFVKTNSTFDWNRKCDDPVVVPCATGKGVSFDLPIGNDYAADARIGFDLGWSVPMGDCEDCENSGGLCNYNITGGGFNKCSCEVSTGFWEVIGKTCPKKGLSTGRKVLIGVFTGLGALLVVLLLTYIAYRKSNSKSSKNVETFLQSFGNLALQRYKYSDIKKMTNSFKDTLGKGGYGCVFKGKLTCDGRLVAVKMLNESKGNGEDFINEVATIGRTNHVNVVSLLGFCIEGTKRALVYEFMPNGSLERFIYNEKTSNTPLGWEKLYQIALGIARGLEYLHRGCNTRILHFDIKPHNILLDQEFCPKISDFGLAKLCPTRESVVSMLVARGTIGYIAPEVYCSNFGGVSHKSDVYSYGMMVFEIIGGRKNIDPTVENISEIYFPQWVYNHLIKQDINVEGSGEIFKDEITKKMIIVASWCIQLQPADRPSISKVVEMLEGSAEDLQMPPNPFQDPPSRSSP